MSRKKKFYITLYITMLASLGFVGGSIICTSTTRSVHWALQVSIVILIIFFATVSALLFKTITESD